MMTTSLISLEICWDSYIFRMRENTRVCMGKPPCLFKLHEKKLEELVEYSTK